MSVYSRKKTLGLIAVFFIAVFYMEKMSMPTLGISSQNRHRMKKMICNISTPQDKRNKSMGCNMKQEVSKACLLI